MLGLRTQESKKFNSFFEIVQNNAAKKDCVFFLDSGEGHDILTDTLEGEDLSGWLIPIAKAADFEKVWHKRKEDDNWVDFFCFARWNIQNESIVIAFE